MRLTDAGNTVFQLPVLAYCRPHTVPLVTSMRLMMDNHWCKKGPEPFRDVMGHGAPENV